MRREDKQVDGPELERDAGLREDELQAIDEEELPEIASDVQRDPALEHRSQLLGAMRMILERETLVVSQLRLPQREERALEALQAAVSGKSANLDQFVFADDRGDMLEQALAVLQINLTRGDDRAVAELHAKYGDLIQRVATLRHDLRELADSQDELLEANQKLGLVTETETGDKPTPKPPAVEPNTVTPTPKPPAVDSDAPKPASTLIGPDVATPPPQPSTLVGPEPAPEPPRRSTLTGPDVAAESPRRSTLTAPPDAATHARSDTGESPPTTLTGPELPAEPAPASSVWDADTPIPPPPISRAQELQPKPADEAAAAATKKPWWRRPFG